MTTTGKALFERLNDAEARVETIIHLVGMMAVGFGENFSDPLDDFLGSLEADTLRECFPDIPAAVDEAVGAPDGNEMFFEWVMSAEKWGFVVCIATPVMRPDGYSWGYYRTRWVYGDTFDEAVEKGLAWVAEQRTEEVKEAQ